MTAVTARKVSNNYLDNNPAFDVAKATINSKDYQVVILADSDGNLLSSPAALSPVDATQADVAVSATSGIMVAADSTNGNKGYLFNPSSGSVVYLSYNTPATTSDMDLQPGGYFNLHLSDGTPVKGALYGRTTSGSATLKLVKKT